MNRVWTEEELEILRSDRAARIPIPVTAAKLGRPVPATYARARLIGTLVQHHQPWDEASVGRLRALLAADPPMTDKRIAAELDRTVTQIRWKMQDLGLIGVRDLSKLAKITAAGMARPKPATPQPVKPVASERPPRTVAVAAAPAPKHAPAPIDRQAVLKNSIARLEASMAERLKQSITESEKGMIEAAKATIAEKMRMDQRLAVLATPPVAKTIRVVVDRAVTETPKARELAAPKAKAVRKLEPASLPLVRTVEEKPTTAPRKPAAKKNLAPSLQGASRAVAPRSVAPSVAAPASAPRIVVNETPVAARPVEQDIGPTQTSGRGGWKSVRRDAARVMAKAKAKATNRADAVDLAQAAQNAIERFIAERGVTRTETSGIQGLVSRLQARGYIVVKDGDAWVIDQRHRVEGESALTAFAEARGIRLDIAA